jgi:hypothetical protein
VVIVIKEPLNPPAVECLRRRAADQIDIDLLTVFIGHPAANPMDGVLDARPRYSFPGKPGMRARSHCLHQVQHPLESGVGIQQSRSNARQGFGIVPHGHDGSLIV